MIREEMRSEEDGRSLWFRVSRFPQRAAWEIEDFTQRRKDPAARGDAALQKKEQQYSLTA